MSNIEKRVDEGYDYSADPNQLNLEDNKEVVDGYGSKLSEKSWHFKLLALFCAVFFSAGSHFATTALNSVKTQLKDQGINNTEYGAAQAAVYLINTFMPLVGGVFMDRFGTAWGALISSTVILVGNVFIAGSTHIKSLGMLIFGRILHGFGSGAIVVAQETILGKWFTGSLLGTVMGLQIGASRLYDFLAQGVVPTVAESTGFVGNGLWLAVGFCLLSWVATLIYAFVLVKAGGEKISEKARRTPFSPKRLFYLPTGFWVMPYTILLLTGVWTPFLGSVADFVQQKTGSSTVVSAWTSSVSLLVPVILSPFIGGFIDRFGYRSVTVFLAGVTNLLGIVLLGYSDISPFVGLTLFSISLTIGPVALTSSVPLMLPEDMVGTGIGTHKVGLSVGAAICHLLLGHLQDLTPNQSYTEVMKMLTILCCLSILMSFVYTFYNKRYLSNLFDTPFTKRNALLQDHPHLPPNLETEQLYSTSIYRKLLIGFMTALIIITIIFFTWSLVENPLKYIAKTK